MVRNFIEQLRQRLQKPQEPEQIHFIIGKVGENSDGIEPGIYVETNIPLGFWDRNEDIRKKVNISLLTNEDIQRFLGEAENAHIPLGEDVVIPANMILKIEAVAFTDEGYVCLKVDRGELAEAVQAVKDRRVTPK